MLKATSSVFRYGPHPVPQPITLDEYIELFKYYGVYEVVNGEVKELPDGGNNPLAPTFQALYDSLDTHVQQDELGVVATKTVFVLQVDPSSGMVKEAFVPFLAFISAERLREQRENFPDDRVYRVAPDLVIDAFPRLYEEAWYLRNPTHYFKLGVHLIILVDRKSRSATRLMDNQEGSYYIGPQADLIHDRLISDYDGSIKGFPVLPNWSIPLQELWDAEPGT
jgi:hypothetical protein